MKINIIKCALFAAFVVSCNATKNTAEPSEKNSIPPVSSVKYNNSFLENAIIYEANIRQYSPEGTFNAFTKDIPKLKQLGVKVIWLMPIHEVGMKNRKAFGDKSIDQVPENDRSKYYGSHYSVKDYRSVTPNYGTKKDFDALVNTAHQNGMLVILDWVANHTAWDHAWVTEHNDYYTRDAKGNMIAPFDWTDVAELDFNNQNLRDAMIEDMKYWIESHNIDGFRCDVAMEVPRDFWERATKELNAQKPVFMLMEAEQKDLMEKAFDMQYGWRVHHIFNKIYKGENTVADLDTYFTETIVQDSDDIHMNFTSNHDENSWNGTEYERLNDAVETFAALTYVLPGMPLIYNGQEYDLKKRLKFFEKDQFEKNKGKMWSVYEKLGVLKNTNPALNGGKNKAAFKRITTNNDSNILCIERSNAGKKVIYLANLTKGKQTLKMPFSGTFLDYMNNKSITFAENQEVELNAWQYYIITN